MGFSEIYYLERIRDELKFFFVSTNENGENSIYKIIVYDPIVKENTKYYNLGFGDLNIATGEVDDEAESNNGDMRKIFATVISTLSVFFDLNPLQKVHIDGSTPLRKEYYHKLIRDYYKTIIKHYTIEGFVNGRVEDFVIGKEYDFILIGLK